MKRIYTMLTAALMLAGTTLWCGCSNNELIDSTTGGAEKQKPAGSFSFNLKGLGVGTRATQVALSDESKVNAMYVVLFIQNDGGDESASKLHRVFFYDGKNNDGEWAENLKMTYDNTDGEKFTISKENMEATNTYTGTYLGYFIANPEDAIEATLKGYLKTDGDTRTTLGDFETELMAKSVVEGGTGDNARGFTMLSRKEKIEIAESPRTKDVTLTRLAARFDFINSSPDNVTVTSIKFNNMAKQSFLVPQSESTPEGNLYDSGDAATTKSWTGGENNMTIYTYENLNTKAQTQGAGNSLLYPSVTVSYTLDADGAGDVSTPVSKTLRIELAEGETPLAVMRNHLYKINMNCVTGTYDLTVQDWVGGETVTVPNKKLAITYTADSLGKIGDYAYLKDGKLEFIDGGLRTMYLDGSLGWEPNFTPTITSDAKNASIGIVFSNQVSATDKQNGYKGYIMSQLSVIASWGSVVADDGNAKCSTYKDLYNDLDGLAYCEKVKQSDSNLSNYPALKEIQSFSRPSDASIWYVPTVGQWFLFLKNIGNVDMSSHNFDVPVATQFYINANSKTLVDNFNKVFGYIGGISDLWSNGWSWTSSGIDNSMGLGFATDVQGGKKTYIRPWPKKERTVIHPVIAFK